MKKKHIIRGITIQQLRILFSILIFYLLNKIKKITRYDLRVLQFIFFFWEDVEKN